MHYDVYLEVFAALEGYDRPDESEIDEDDARQFFSPGEGCVKGVTAHHLQKRQGSHGHHEEGGNGLENEIDPLPEMNHVTPNRRGQYSLNSVFTNRRSCPSLIRTRF